jgi:hypothetical protein
VAKLTHRFVVFIAGVVSCAQAIIHLNNAMPIDEPFSLEVRCYMVHFGVWAAQNPQHCSATDMHNTWDHPIDQPNNRL